MIIAVPVTDDEQVDPRWGKARNVAVAKVEDGAIRSWEVFPVGWDVLHDQGEHGTHHARIVTFLRNNNVDGVVINHAGTPMMNTMAKMGLAIAVDAAGPARHAALRAAEVFSKAD